MLRILYFFHSFHSCFLRFYSSFSFSLFVCIFLSAIVMLHFRKCNSHTTYSQLHSIFLSLFLCSSHSFHENTLYSCPFLLDSVQFSLLFGFSKSYCNFVHKFQIVDAIIILGVVLVFVVVDAYRIPFVRSFNTYKIPAIFFSFASFQIIRFEKWRRQQQRSKKKKSRRIPTYNLSYLLVYQLYSW